MKILFKESPNINDFSEIIQALDTDPDIKTILILSCDNNDYNINDINSLLKRTRKNIFGGLFPEIIYNNNKYSNNRDKYYKYIIQR